MKQEMINGHNWHGLICIENEVYVFGSYDGNPRASEVYRIDHNEWVALPDMPVEYGSILSCALQDTSIFIVGYYLKTVLKFDLLAKEFSELSCNMPHALRYRTYKNIWTLPNNHLLYSDKYGSAELQPDGDLVVSRSKGYNYVQIGPSCIIGSDGDLYCVYRNGLVYSISLEPDASVQIAKIRDTV